MFAKKGETLTRFGGWGYLFEEGGSGYAIGKAAICAALQEEDGLEEKSLLTQLVQDKLGSTAWGSLHRLYGNLPLLSRILRRLSFRRTPAQTAGRNVSWRNTPVALPG